MDKQSKKTAKPEIEHPYIREIDHQTAHPSVEDSTTSMSQETKRSSFYPTA